MKIAYFFTELGLSGGPIVHYQMLNNLKLRGHNILVVTSKEFFLWEFDSHLQYIKKPSFLQNVRRAATSFLKPKTTRRIVTARGEIDRLTKALVANYSNSGFQADTFIATHTYTADAVFLSSGGQSCFIYDLHFEELMFSNIADRLEIRKLNNLPLQHVVNSSWLNKMFRHNYNIDCRLVYPVINNAIFDCEPAPNRYFSETVTIVSYCDPHRPFKGHTQQRNILERIKTVFGPRVNIIIYGHDIGPCCFEYEFLGWISHSELGKLYSRAHILLMPSWFESFPLPPIEAMSCGCVAVANGYGTEDYLHHGVTGLVINPFDIQESTEQLSSLINDRNIMLKLATNGYQMSQHFISYEKVVEQFEGVLMDVPEKDFIDIDRVLDGRIEEFLKLDDIPSQL